MSKLPATLHGVINEFLKAPERVPFGKLQVDHSRFQVRNPNACNHVDSIIKGQEAGDLVKSLLDVVEDGHELDPLVVWRGPEGNLWVIDGFLRHEALEEAATPSHTRVWVQMFKGATESEARHYALDANKRDHLNLHKRERIEMCWRFLLTGESTGVVRDRAKRYDVSKSTVSRMDAKAPEVLTQLQAMAAAEGVPCDPAFIRDNAPLWKGLDDVARVTEGDPDTLTVLAIERLMKSLTLRYAKEAKARPDVMLKALEGFYTGTTGRHASFRDEEQTSGDEEF